jgi:hypothetical protein
MVSGERQSVPLPRMGVIAATLAPFAILLSAALLLSEAQTLVVLHRAIYTIWLSIAFATPAYALYVTGFRGNPFRVAAYEYWRLLWTFAFFAYIIHFYYAFFGLHRASFTGVFQQQTSPVALTNFAFTFWWIIDVAALWLIPQKNGWWRVERNSFQIFSFAVFVAAFVFLRPGIPQLLGLIMIVSVAVALLRRWLKVTSSSSMF